MNTTRYERRPGGTAPGLHSEPTDHQKGRSAMSVDTNTDLRVKITRHEVPDSMVCDLGPANFRIDDIVTAVCGEVSGTIVRHVDDETEDGTREVLHEVRIDGSHETGGFSSWCAYTPASLDELTRVALALEAEWGALQ
jgi:hypothetical protein